MVEEQSPAWPLRCLVELVPGVKRLVHVSEVSWARIQNPDEVLSVGDADRVNISVPPGQEAWGNAPVPCP